MVKGNWSRYRPGVAQRVGRGLALLFHDRGTRRGWVVSNSPRPHFTPRKDTVPILQGLGGSQGRSGRAKNLVPTGIRSRTIQPVVSRYTDWATRPTREYGLNENRRFQDTNPHTTTLARHAPPYEYTGTWRTFIFKKKTQTNKSSGERQEFLHDDKIIIMLMSSYRTNIHTHSEIQTRILNVWTAQDCVHSLVFSLQAGLCRNQSPLMWPVWLWHTASWASSWG